ncbi:hypothetical protein C8R44DRAFT_882055 [Mycena epipterygia]|nr:hypothetical protein C8R44DRAFT_882055 [Mycena epipterygia]
MSTAATRAADRARNADIETEILYLERRISLLRIEQAPIQQRLDSYMYPVLALPTEIVSEIFIQFLPVYPRCPPMLGLLSPNLLAQICRKWREIALSTPALWRAISLDRDSDHAGDNILQQVHILQSWLRRSGSCPLSIQMNGGVDGSFILNVFEAIVPHRARWEFLKLASTSLSDLDTIEGPMPLLCDLSFAPFDGDSSDSTPSATFCQAPRLRAFTDTRWHGGDFTYPPDFLPWSQLTSVTLVRVTPSECAPILTQTVNLVHCQLVVFEDYIYQLDLELPCLESLVLMKYRKRYVPLIRYLNQFIVPALRRLQVPDEFLGPSSIDMLKSFILKSGCQLQEVCITGKRSLSRASYRHAFPSIPNFTFNRELTHWEDDEESDDEEEDDEESHNEESDDEELGDSNGSSVVE